MQLRQTNKRKITLINSTAKLSNQMCMIMKHVCIFIYIANSSFAFVDEMQISAVLLKHIFVHDRQYIF